MNAVLDWCQTLLSFPEDVWVEYARCREPLCGKVPFADYRGYWNRAVAEGREQARLLRESCGALPLRDCARQLQVTVEDKPFPEGGSGRSTYACFYEPDRIEIYRDNADLLRGLTAAAQADELLEHVDVCDVLLAHELYHVLQYRHPEFYTMQQHILLWRLLGHEKRSRLVSLEEVAAMAFAGSLTGIHYTPYVYDVLLMLPHYPEQAKEIYRGLLAIRDRQRKEEA